MKGKGEQAWDELMGMVEGGRQKESGLLLEKLQRKQRTDVMVKSICLTNLMMKLFREDYSKVMQDIWSCCDLSLSIKCVVASSQVSVSE